MIAQSVLHAFRNSVESHTIENNHGSKGCVIYLKYYRPQKSNVIAFAPRFSFSPWADGPKEGFTPMDNQTWACTDSLEDGSGPCSCQD